MKRLITYALPVSALLLACAACLCDDGSVVADEQGTAGPQTTTWTHPGPVARQVSTTALPDVRFLSTNCDPEGDMPREVTFTPDGSAVVIVNRDTDNMVFVDVATRTITGTVPLEDFPVHVAVTPDGRYAVAPNVFSNSVSVVDVATRTVVAHVPITGDQPYRVATTSDSRYVVVGVINDAVNSSFSIIDLLTMTEVRTFASAPQGVFGAFFTPESGIWGNIFTQFALTPDGSMIVLPDRGGNRVMLYDVATGVELAALPVASRPTAVDVSADSTVAVVSHEGADKVITEVDLVNRVVSGSFATTDSLGSQVIRITPDKAYAMAAISNNLIFVDLTTGARTATLYTGSVGDIEISFDGRYAFVSNYNARVIDIASQSIVGTITFAACVEAAASPVEYRAVALNSRFGEDVHFYNTNGASGFFEGRILSGEPPEGDATRTLAIAPDGETVVAANVTSRNVSIIELPAKTVRSYVDTGNRPLGIAVTPDGKYAVVANGDSDSVSVIDLTTDMEVANLYVSSRPAEVRVSPDSRYAYVTTVAGTDRVHFIELDGASSRVLGSLITGQMGSMIYTYNVISGIELSPDGATLALCISFDDQLMLVDTASMTEVARLSVGDFPIRVAFSPDSRKAYVANSNSDNVYKIDVNGALSSVEAVIGGIDFPLTVTVDDTGSFVYVGSFNLSAPAIYVIDTSTDAIAKRIALTDRPRCTYLCAADSILYVATAGGELVRIDAAGAASAIIDTVALTNAPSDMVFSESMRAAVIAQPVPDGVDIVAEPIMPICPAGWLNPGWNWFSIPLCPFGSAEASDILGFDAENILFAWDPVAKNYGLYPQDFTNLARGCGYLLRLNADRQPSYAAFPGLADFEIPLPEAGWTWIGQPFDHDTNLADCVIRNNTTNTTRTAWADFQDPNGWINWNILWWDSAVDSWKLLALAGGDDDTLHPWYGYLVWANARDLALIVPRN